MRLLEMKLGEWEEYNYPFMKERLEKEHRRNELNKYCRKVEYYRKMGWVKEEAIEKARKFYKIGKR